MKVLSIRSMTVAGLCLVGVSALCLTARAADWPGFRGPDRTDVSTEKMLKQWPAGGPKLLWSSENVGIGYSGPAVVAGKLYTMGARGGNEFILCLDAASGKELWAAEIAAMFRNGYGDGPRGTPAVDGKLVYGMGGQGTLACVDTAGKVMWRKNMKSDFGGRMMSGWGYSESVLVDGDKVLATPGGNRGAVVALNKTTGATVWQSAEFGDAAAYSSLVPAEIGGVKQYVQLTGTSVAGVSAADGKLLWKSGWPGRTAVIPTPIVKGNHVFVSSGYGVGCKLVEVGADGKSAKDVYDNKNITNHHGGVVLVGEHLYGYSDGRGWVCMELKTGKVVWNDRDKLGKGSVTCVDGMLICYSERGGECVLIEASPAGWKEHGRFRLPKQTTQRSNRGAIWTHPVVSDGKLFLRDQELLFCFDVKGN